jgi:hypothetical protein
MLVEIILEKKDFTEALLYGRRAYKAFKKKKGSEGSAGCMESPGLLLRVCSFSGMHTEADAYGSLLADLGSDKQEHGVKSMASENVSDEWKSLIRGKQQPSPLVPERDIIFRPLAPPPYLVDPHIYRKGTPLVHRVKDELVKDVFEPIP